MVTLDAWTYATGVHASGKHGGKFVGNQVRDLLNNLSKLEEILFDNKVLDECQEVIELLKLFLDVKKKCFGKKAEEGWKEAIASFCSKKRMIDDMSFILKMHVLEVHVPQFLDMMHKIPKFQGCGLGVFAEQAFECVHQDFGDLWENYERDPESDTYDTQLNKCVYTYNARHM